MKEIKPEARLIVAADFKPEGKGVRYVEDEVLKLCDDLVGLGVVIKVNSILRAAGYDLIEKIRQRGLKCFADLKLNDISNTMETDGELLRRFQPEILTIMATSDVEGMAKVKKALPHTTVLGVTVLTSINFEKCIAMYADSPEAVVPRLAGFARDAKLDGVVCSPHEGKLLRFGEQAARIAEVDVPDFEIVTPGIRYPWSEVLNDDQARTGSAGFAIGNGVTRVVVGRPILNAKANSEAGRPQSRREAAEWIIRDIREALEKPSSAA
jgi:orotidine-5'-phosphate decarboxylase